MASAFVSETQVQSDRQARPLSLSLSLDAPPSASPYPSPSSTFLPPPIPGAHEFAVKPPPPRKGSVVHYVQDHSSATATATTSLATPDSQSPLLANPSPLNSSLFTPQPSPAPQDASADPDSSPSSSAFLMVQQNGWANGARIKSSLSETERTGSSLDASAALLSALPLPSFAAQTPTPTPTPTQSSMISNAAVPPSPTSPAFYTPPSPSISRPTSLMSSRPAPPSPAVSRRVSQAPSASSASSAHSRSSSPRPSSTVMSRASSIRKTHQRLSLSGSILAAASAAAAVSSPTALLKRFSGQMNGNGSASAGAGAGGTASASNGARTPHRLSTSSFSSARSSELDSESDSDESDSSDSPASPSVPKLDSAPPTATAAPLTSPPPSAAPPRIKIRDFAFSPDDARHTGHGPDVPRSNRVARLHRRLRGTTPNPGEEDGEQSSTDGSDEEVEMEEEVEEWGDDAEEEDGAEGSAGWNAFRLGVGRFSWLTPAAAESGGYPAQADLQRNFGGGDEEAVIIDDSDEYYDAEEEEEEPLYPGLYRALYAFEPEGTAEMALEEDQIVRVIGRGGGVGWAVVVVPAEEGTTEGRGQGDGEDSGVRHALVPESYLEPVKLDYESQE